MKIAFAALFALACSSLALAQHYVVLCGVGPGDPYHAAAERLAAEHKASLREFDPRDLAPVKAALRAEPPQKVAVVLRPDQLDYPFARAFLQMATEIDDDPFVDFDYGFITGRTPEDALALVAAAARAGKQPREATKLAQVCGGLDRSWQQKQPYRLLGATLPCLQAFVRGKENEGHDQAFVATLLPKLADASVVTFIGHGMPREVVGGPDAADLAQLRLDDAVVLNVACYTGVTSAWFDMDWQAGRWIRRTVAPEDSFGLALLHTGVAGYTAYTCPRPAGPELDTDLIELIARGASLGEARRRDYDKTVLGFLGYGATRLALAEVADGAPMPPVSDSVRDIMLEGATGGILFGDPALVPFAAHPERAPVQIAWQQKGEAIDVTATCPAHALYLQCSDPTAEFGKQMAMKMHARIPIGQAFVADVTVGKLTVGGDEPPSRRLFALEQDQGEHFAQVKVMFERPVRPGDLTVHFTIALTNDGKLAKAIGGDLTTDPARSETPRSQAPGSGKDEKAAPAADPRSTAITQPMRELAGRCKVGEAALQTALRATAAELDVPGLDPAGCREALKQSGSEGFRALCVLLELGHHHYRTPDLLALTWSAGDEARLLELAARDPLPNYATWSVLEGLGTADTKAVRECLRKRLQQETDAGLFMATAKGLARLRDEKAVSVIGARLLERREGWLGVAPHLMAALQQIGGDAAGKILTSYEAGK